MLIDPDWVDSNGMVKPRKNFTDSGNGILYTTMHFVIKDRYLKPSNDITDFQFFRLKLGHFTVKLGLYRKTPSGSFGQQTWDDYLGLVAYSIIAKDKQLARDIFWYGIKHFGFYNSDGKSEGKDWLWRSWHVFFGILPIAAYPWLAIPMRPLLWFQALFLKAETPKVYLDWMWFYAVYVTGYKHSKLDALTYDLAASLRFEYDINHPSIALAETFRQVPVPLT